MDRATQNLSKLPDLAFIDNRDHGAGRRVPAAEAAVIMVRKGVSGYAPLHVALSADVLNKEADVTPQQREALFAGSVFGFGVLAADPDMYDGQGNLLSAPCKGYAIPMARR